ncbi:tetratricopeptide repeat protein [Pseudemcibacter aquimaris]|uniref:tetratricopeptide repeat protein n=1 Tax=Pseudemcibacter aquimaris TaxID=2857064 RepID=UPI00201181B4|nr:tetratricopeptide repeat protein [Pseudemcibacter aquimaris]MCC3861473.1 tetratricopeptide repeat protein [Pseudemcibacter aquimaris]WDU58242.1 tetratricopeptide repeat protein [Pseudemcibacter aquimaris]
MKYMVFFILLFSSPALAQVSSDADQAKKYMACIEEVEKDSKKSLITAKEWHVNGGGVPAQHCEALSLYQQSRYDEAAEILEMIAEKVSKGEDIGSFAAQNTDLLSSQLRYLAARSWQMAEKYDQAYHVYTVAILALEKIPALTYDFYIERGLLQADREEYQSAVEDFANALKINYERIDAFLYRAETFRKMGEHVKARLDLNEALILEPNHPDILFESGANYRMLNQDAKARVEWRKIIEKYPETDLQKLAEDNLKLIDG